MSYTELYVNASSMASMHLPALPWANYIVLLAAVLPRRARSFNWQNSPVVLDTWIVKGEWRAVLRQGNEALWPTSAPGVTGKDETAAIQALEPILKAAGAEERLQARLAEVRGTLNAIDALATIFQEGGASAVTEDTWVATARRAQASVILGRPWELRGSWKVRDGGSVVANAELAVGQTRTVESFARISHYTGTSTFPLDVAARVAEQLQTTSAVGGVLLNALRDAIGAVPAPTPEFVATHEMIHGEEYTAVRIERYDAVADASGEGDPDQWHALDAEGEPVAISNTVHGQRRWTLNTPEGPTVELFPRFYTRP